MLYCADKYGSVYSCDIRENYRILVLSGGAMKGGYLLGMLFSLKEKLNNIHTYCGISSGSIICFLMSIGLSPYDIFIKLFQTKKWLLVNNKSFFKSTFINSILQDAIYEKFKTKDLTFSEHFKLTNKKIIIGAFNLSKGKQEIFTSIETPFMSCIKAIQLSSNLPFIFETLVWENDIYIDGGIIDNFPINLFKKETEHILALTTLFGHYNRFKYTQSNLHVIMVNDGISTLYLDATNYAKYTMFTEGCNYINNFKIKPKRRKTL